MTRLKRDMVGFLDQATPPRSTVERRADRERALEELRRRGFSTIPARRKGRAITARRERGLRLQQQLGAPDQAEAQVEALEAELAELKRPRRRSARQDLPEDDRLALDWLRSLARDDGISLKQLVSRLIEARRRSP